MDNKINIDDLLGCPYLIHGRNRKGFDCYGLVIEVEKRLGRTLDDFYSEYSNIDCEQKLNENAEAYINNMKLKKTDRPDFGDIVLFLDNKGRSVHIGVYLKKGDFIHCDKRGVNVERLDSYFRKRKEFYTWLK